MKKVIYTCLFGHYDKLRQPLVVDGSFDYICFSNDYDEENIGVWRIKKIPNDLNLDHSRLSRFAKILPHEVLQEYDYSLYLDANIQIVSKSFYEIINLRIDENSFICQVPHLSSNCIYDEIRKAYFAGRVSWLEAKKQYRHILSNGFPVKYGLFENNIILRKHNEKIVKDISERWWCEYINYSKRDQFCLMFVYWKMDYLPSYIFDSTHNVRNVECLNYLYHSKASVLGSQLNQLDRNNPLRKLGRFFHTKTKMLFIKLFLS